MNIYFVSLGCDKNRVDSEEMLGLLAASGFSFCNDEKEADVIIVNTCAFIDSAKEESIETILELAAMKKEGRCKRLVVTGCLAERYRDDIMNELPEVDAVVGVNELEKVVTAAEPSAACNLMIPHRRVITTSGHYEFLKIAEGCNKHCTYCAIPNIRGRYRSYPMDKLLNEAKELAEAGVKELIVVAQETTIYGRDIYGEDKLPELLNELCKIDGFKWIRLLYAYPEDITEDLLKTMASQDKIVHYIDMPIQHSSDKILKRMGRRTDRNDLINKINLVRSYIPDVALRTSLITGFPGETEEDHKDLLNFVKEVRFDRLGVFTYSQEEGTPAAGFEGQIDEDTKNKRKDEIMNLQLSISRDKLSERVGDVFDIIIEGYLPDCNAYAARTYMDTPDVDGYFYLESDRELMTGDMLKAVCTASDEYDLFGELV